MNTSQTMTDVLVLTWVFLIALTLLCLARAAWKEEGEKTAGYAVALFFLVTFGFTLIMKA